VLDMSTLGDAADVNLVIKFLPHTLWYNVPTMCIWSCICNFVTLVFIDFNFKFCSKYVLFYINCFCPSVLVTGRSVTWIRLTDFWMFLYPLDELLYMDILVN
jgi:hypothetical protein